MATLSSEDVRNRKHSSIARAVGVSTCIVTMEINMVVTQKTGMDPPQYLAVPLLEIYPQNATSYYRDACISMFITVSFTINSKEIKSA